jgi:flavodoxin
MDALVIYESLTGTTRRAAGLIAAELGAAGVATTVSSVRRVDLAALAAAELVIVGSWTDGLVFFGQKPGRSDRLKGLPVMYGKRAAVYVTYAVDPGRAVSKLEDIVRDRGADVIGGMAIRRTDLGAHVADFVDRLLAAVAA